jgi:hypothetical protein
MATFGANTGFTFPFGSDDAVPGYPSSSPKNLPLEPRGVRFANKRINLTYNDIGQLRSAVNSVVYPLQSPSDKSPLSGVVMKKRGARFYGRTPNSIKKSNV